MQTFLPYPNFDHSARCLDRLRLGKQRVEVLQLLKAITAGGGWQNHPAAKMWRGHVNALVRYGVAICLEWQRRGYRDACAEQMLAFHDPAQSGTAPPWLGDHAFHAAHRSNLLRKDPAWYGHLGWTEPADMPYVWPV